MEAYDDVLEALAEIAADYRVTDPEHATEKIHEIAFALAQDVSVAASIIHQKLEQKVKRYIPSEETTGMVKYQIN